ncbi:MAG: GntR family transcriptional regulator [Candidatus Omnitrophica bacterium]|nr:GntR family transcriptional regulator [Candidatus Omnitrophota bacterium]
MKTKANKLSEKVITFLIENASGGNGRSEITEESIASHFKVSRTPVREVLKRLEHNGIIQTRRSRGISFKTFSYGDVQDIYEVRTVLEELAIREAVSNVTPENLKQLRMCALANRNARMNRNKRKANDADRVFHETIMELSGNGYLKRLIKEIRVVTTSFLLADNLFYLSRTDMNPHSHDKIVKALARKDPERAAKAVREHILWSKNNILRHLEENRKNEGNKNKNSGGQAAKFKRNKKNVKGGGK